VGFVVLVLGAIHVWPRRTPGIPALLVLWLAVGVVLAIVVAVTEPANGWFILTNVAVFAFLVEVIIFVYAVAVASVSVRILVMLLQREAEPDGFQITLQACSADFFLGHRLERLEAQGLLTSRHGRYCLTEKGQQWARVGSAMKALLAVGAGG
jgi:hypothetical protein